MNRLSSTRLRLAPIPPILISSRAVMASLPLVLGGGLARSGALQLAGRPHHGLHDVLVARAAAEVAGQRPTDLVLGRVRVLLEQRGGREHHPGGAEPALQAVLVRE